MQEHTLEPSGSPTCEFMYNWARCEGYMCQEISLKSVNGAFHHASILISLLSLHSDSSDQILSPQGRTLLRQLTELRPLDRILVWVESKTAAAYQDVDHTVSANTRKPDSKLYLRDIQRRRLGDLFEVMLSLSRVEIFSDFVVVRPLLQYLFKLNSQIHTHYESVYGRLLKKFFILLCRCKALFGVCKHVSDEQFGQPYMVFSLLVPLLHRYDSVGDSARDALLLVLHLSKSNDQLANYLAFQSDICPILATGLSALYSSLPKKLVPRYHFSPDSPGGPVQFTTTTVLRSGSSVCAIELPVGGANWHQLTDWEWNQSPDLRRLLHTLDFCNLVVKISHAHVRDQLLNFINSGFLVPIIGSALHQSAMDGVVAATAYLELFLRRLTEPDLIKLFLTYILTGSHDNYSVLTSLIHRLNANAVVVTDVMYQLGMVTLSLFRTILQFHCEDVMYELIFKHLRPLHHIVLPINEFEGPQHTKTSPPSARLSTGSRLSQNQLFVGLLTSADRFMDLASAANVSGRLPLRPVLSGSNIELQSSHTPYPEHESEDEAVGLLKLAEPPGTPSLVAYIQSAYERITRRRKACRTWTSTYDFVVPEVLLGNSMDSESLSDGELASLEVEAQQHSSNRLVCGLSGHKGTGFHSPTGIMACNSLLSKVSSMYQLNYIESLSEDDSDEKDESKSLVETEVDTMEAAMSSQVNLQAPDDGSASPISEGIQSSEETLDREICCTCNDQQLERMEYLTSLIAGENLDTFLSLLDGLDPPWQCRLHFGNLPPSSSWPPIDAGTLNLLDFQFTELSLPAGSDAHNGVLPVSDPVPSPLNQPNVRTDTTGPSLDLPAKESLTSCTPTASGVGPFLSILLGRLVNMHTNCLFTNLLLTDLVAALASYPCPLLSHFLLNSVALQLKSNVASLHKTIRSVQSQLHAMSASVTDWKALVLRARLYLHTSDGAWARISSNRTRIVPNFYASPSSGGEPTGVNDRQCYTSCPSTPHQAAGATAISSPVCLTVDQPCTSHDPEAASRQANTSGRADTAPPRASIEVIEPLCPVSLTPQSSVPRYSTRRQTVPSRVELKQSSSPLLRRGLGRRLHSLNSSDSEGEKCGDDANPVSQDVTVGKKTCPLSDVGTRTRNLVFAAVIFDEFCFELSGLCYAHCLGGW